MTYKNRLKDLSLNKIGITMVVNIQKDLHRSFLDIDMTLITNKIGVIVDSFGMGV